MSGFNTEIIHGNKKYHIQTQDKGPPYNYIETIIYCSGRVLTTRRFAYSSYLPQGSRETVVPPLVKKQHERICQQVKEGRFDHL
ncbi:MAG: hypothetical protein B5M54_10790 [Candidatus Aminicenantes bacterium 4484_214]|nr:MAG: hypothetical protein B5M54_10790 [Candidatus Aminicenantes bacterium 4484_214]RLE09956.1 MAG: hypothetical protein DRJ06_01875 [Candidatus Aminicenantes bacterium]HDJ23470.1 hypothetical protein [Candidatus Aminicenantes bacterium]